MENEHEMSYETLTRVYLGSYEHYKGVVAEVEHSKPVFELQGAKMDHMGSKDCCLMGLRKKRYGASLNELSKLATECVEAITMSFVGGQEAKNDGWTPLKARRGSCGLKSRNVD
ncbi:hypothetical protein Tco_1106971 [Tanacetum coccineum]